MKVSEPEQVTDELREVQQSPRRWWILAALCLSLMVVVIDNTVLNVAIPSLVSELGASSSQIQWILDSYILVFAGLLLTAGSLSDRHGRRLGLVVGLVVFGAASLAASFAVNPTQLIIARAVMGLGAAFLMPGTLSIITTVFSDAERKKAIAIWSSVLMLGALAGPTLGGVLLEHFWWGSVFLINVPIAAVGIIAALIIIPESRGAALPPDVPGAITSTLGLAALIWAIIEASERGWADGTVLAFLAAAVVLLLLFVIRESKAPNAMLPMSLFRERNFSGASLSIVLLALASGGILLALTQYLQFVLGFSPLRAGLALTPLVVVGMAFNGVGVIVDKKFGARVAVSTGLLLLAAGFASLLLIDTGDGYGTLTVALVVLGAGSGIAGPAAYGTLLGSLPKDRAGVGSAVNDTVQQVGQALSIAVLGTVLTAVFRSEMPGDAPAAVRNSVGAAMQTARATGDDALAAAAQQSFVSAMSVTAVIGVCAGVVAAVVAGLVLRRPPAATKPDPSAELQTAGR
ncbi:MFS transporter [Nakamurella aerolata]|uniref:MFS transporter n=1 Tax=Nakamurella aerolata TaxID=1656892 RepID=A0A849AC03_9ACTN|nr:MFS transporter [Nakamurella aerolata]NNG36020.1 MFS transporter [Nakamurella aerolata]